MSNLIELLKERFEPKRAGELDATLEFNWSTGRCLVGVHHGEAIYYELPSAAPDPELVLYFRNEAQAADILSGRSNPVDAFMKGEFRSNGYLVWAFQTLSAFSKSATNSSSPATLQLGEETDS